MSDNEVLVTNPPQDVISILDAKRILRSQIDKDHQELARLRYEASRLETMIEAYWESIRTYEKKLQDMGYRLDPYGIWKKRVDE